MKKSTFIALIVAAALVVLGILTAVTGLALGGFEWQTLERTQMHSHSVTVSEDFLYIDIDVTTANVRILPSNDGTCHASVREYGDASYNIEVKDDTLFITDTKNWYDFEEMFSLSFRSPSIDLYLPEAYCDLLQLELTTGDVLIDKAITYGRIEIKGTTGDIHLLASAKEAVSIKTTTGDVTLSDMTCTDARIKVTTGDVELVRVLISEKLTVDAVTGDVELSESDAAEIEISVTTGNVEATLLTGKHFTVHTTTGDISYPNNSTGGKCRITTTTGDIEIKIVGK